ncbi:MAG: hypothetical protein P1U34_00820 [Coxiellaceae bacterium]|nr:hypothetical protein [Coxiellaceae bacterium]
MYKKSIYGAAALALVFSGSVIAAAQPDPLSMISYQPSVQGWVTTKTANVTVAVAATLNGNDVASRKNAIMQHLQGLMPKVQWHVSQFSQVQDPSGLTRLSLRAQARLPQSDTSNLAQKLSKLSRSGEKYTLQGMAFAPSLKEVNAAKMELRQQLYQQVLGEISTLNKTYNRQYYPAKIQFISVSPRPMPAMYMKAAVADNATHSAGSVPTVASRLTITANVQLAAKADGKSTAA